MPGIDRTVPRAVSMRAEFVGKLREFVDKNFGGDWRAAYEAVAVSDRITRGTILLMVERVDPKFVATSWHVCCHMIHSMDVDFDGFIDLHEFLKLNA